MKFKFTITNLKNYLGFSLVSSQNQVDAIHFDLNIAIDLISHSILLHERFAFRVFGCHVNLFS
jgi:hypothetical protein